MRPGDYMTVNSAEIELLLSDAFRQAARDELVAKIRLGSDPERADYQRLALPKIGRPVAEVLRAVAADRSTPTEQSVVADHLAERIEERIQQRRR